VVTTISDTFLRLLKTRRAGGQPTPPCARALIVMTARSGPTWRTCYAGRRPRADPGEITGERILEFSASTWPSRRGPHC